VRMVRLTREASQARTRAKLIDAARTVIAEHGYAGASVETIAEAAGFSKGAVYSNFASKEALVLALVDTITEAYKRMSYEIATRHIENPRSFYNALAARFAEEDEATRVVALELLMQARREPALRPALARAYRARWDQWEQMMKTAIASLGGQPVAELKILTEVTAAAIIGQSLLAAGGVNISDRRALVDLLFRALFRLGESPPDQRL